jgi:hypothetical protein
METKYQVESFSLNSNTRMVVLSMIDRWVSFDVRCESVPRVSS